MAVQLCGCAGALAEVFRRPAWWMVCRRALWWGVECSRVAAVAGVKVAQVHAVWLSCYSTHQVPHTAVDLVHVCTLLRMLFAWHPGRTASEHVLCSLAARALLQPTGAYAAPAVAHAWPYGSCKVRQSCRGPADCVCTPHGAAVGCELSLAAWSTWGG